MTSSNLKLRLNKLERRRNPKANSFSQSVLVGVFDDNACEIVGAGICGKTVMREVDETIKALTMRASRQLGMPVLFAIYRSGLEAC